PGSRTTTSRRGPRSACPAPGGSATARSRPAWWARAAAASRPAGIRPAATRRAAEHVRRVPYGPVRDGWRLTNYSLGLTYNDTELPDGTLMSYWQEGPYNDFSEAEIEELETATAALNGMCLEAGDWMVRQCPRSTPRGRRDGFFASVCGPET